MKEILELVENEMAKVKRELNFDIEWWNKEDEPERLALYEKVIAEEKDKYAKLEKIKNELISIK